MYDVTFTALVGAASACIAAVASARHTHAWWPFILSLVILTRYMDADSDPRGKAPAPPADPGGSIPAAGHPIPFYAPPPYPVPVRFSIIRQIQVTRVRRSAFGVRRSAFRKGREGGAGRHPCCKVVVLWWHPFIARCPALASQPLPCAAPFRCAFFEPLCRLPSRFITAPPPCRRASSRRTNSQTGRWRSLSRHMTRFVLFLFAPGHGLRAARRCSRKCPQRSSSWRWHSLAGPHPGRRRNGRTLVNRSLLLLRSRKKKEGCGGERTKHGSP